VILPCNEAGNVLSIRAGCSRRTATQVLVVDGSPDGGDLVERAAKGEPRLHLLRRAGSSGSTAPASRASATPRPISRSC
jgi:hypothetical protein